MLTITNKINIAEKIEKDVQTTVKKTGLVYGQAIRNQIELYRKELTDKQQEALFIYLFTVYGKN
ncbi:MAG: hypothetical protein ACTSPD_09885 [Promethearchaeota archaeon]